MKLPVLLFIRKLSSCFYFLSTDTRRRSHGTRYSTKYRYRTPKKWRYSQKVFIFTSTKCGNFRIVYFLVEIILNTNNFIHGVFSFKFRSSTGIVFTKSWKTAQDFCIENLALIKFIKLFLKSKQNFVVLLVVVVFLQVITLRFFFKQHCQGKEKFWFGKRCAC